MRILLLVLLLGVGCLPPDQPPVAPAAVDPALAVLHAWQITGHISGSHTTIGDADASALDGRTIEMTATSYASPWEGTCNDAAHSRRERPLVDITNESDLDAAARARLIARGFASPVVEYRMTCSDRRALPLVLVVKGDHAFTCFSGICYLLTGRR